MEKVLLLSTQDCHLCEEAKVICAELAIKLEEIDIVFDDQLVELYGDKIPVIMVEGAEQALFWPFNKEHLEQYLEFYGISSFK